MAYNDLVSVTIVTYNSGRFIKRCLESVLEQKYPNLEVIVIDNASTDGTVDLLEQFSDTCQIHYNDENIGFAAAQKNSGAKFKSLCLYGETSQMLQRAPRDRFGLVESALRLLARMQWHGDHCNSAGEDCS